ncbi:hypothetical protein AVEN_211780-1 [Araneus ventricosus]|uniref:Uncharacterized protein n=1 Tax=Araneus ventricosus TaxID=182803 RepID=A0A4Y2SYC1_ARAVE|nr:hypothetical protein AVEN_211780-1 [Araneus ventricosus]
MPSLFMFHTKQPPEIGAMAKITLLHHVAYEKATPSSGGLRESHTFIRRLTRKPHLHQVAYEKATPSSGGLRESHTFITWLTRKPHLHHLAYEKATPSSRGLRESHAFIGADVTGDEDTKQAR